MISGNVATNGGGIAIHGARNDVASSLRLFSTDVRRPVALRHNIASNAGGALWVGAAEVSPGQPGVQVCARDLRIEDNIAADGAALFVGNPFTSVPIGNFVDGSVRFNAEAGTPCGAENDAPSGAVACAPGVTCNTIARNLARDTTGEPTDGATVALEFDALLSAACMAWRGNIGGNVLRFEGLGHTATLDTCLIAQNTVSGEVLRSSGFGSFVLLRDCTVAGNDIAATRVFASETSLGLQTSIIDAPGKTTFLALGTDGAIDAVDVIASEIASLPASPNIMAGTVAFVDAEAGNFRLARDSIAIDFAPSHGGIDLDGKPRPHDAPRADLFGSHDLGAYEWTPGLQPGNLLRDSFEDDMTTL